MTLHLGSIFNPIFLSLALLGAAGTAQARPPRYVASTLDNGPGAQLTRRLENRYKLYEHQLIRLLPFSRTYLAERAALSQVATAEDDRRARLQQLDSGYEAYCYQLLTPWQLNRLHKAHAELAPKESFAYFMANQLA